MNAFILYEGDHLLVALKASPEKGRGVSTVAIRKDGEVTNALVESPSRETSDLLRTLIKIVGEKKILPGIIREALLDPARMKEIRHPALKSVVMKHHYRSITPSPALRRGSHAQACA